MSANCVVFTHYSGDTAAVVDEHFSRALSQTASAAAPSSASVSTGAASSSAAGGFAGTEPGSSGKAAGASKGEHLSPCLSVLELQLKCNVIPKKLMGIMTS